MPGKSRPADTAAIVSDDAIRQRAYFMWEADGRPEGRGDHYWHLAQEEATRAAPEVPPPVKAGKSKPKVKVAEKAKPAKKAKPVEAKAPRKQPKPRAAIQKAP